MWWWKLCSIPGTVNKLDSMVHQHTSYTSSNCSLFFFQVSGLLKRWWPIIAWRNVTCLREPPFSLSLLPLSHFGHMTEKQGALFDLHSRRYTSLWFPVFTFKRQKREERLIDHTAASWRSTGHIETEQGFAPLGQCFCRSLCVCMEDVKTCDLLWFGLCVAFVHIQTSKLKTGVNLHVYVCVVCLCVSVCVSTCALVPVCHQGLSPSRYLPDLLSGTHQKEKKRRIKQNKKSQFTESAHLSSSSLWFFAFLSTSPMYSQIATCHWGFVPAAAHTSSFVRINF